MFCGIRFRTKEHGVDEIDQIMGCGYAIDVAKLININIVSNIIENPLNESLSNFGKHKSYENNYVLIILYFMA